jgi:uncharacterized protein DUF4214
MPRWAAPLMSSGIRRLVASLVVGLIVLIFAPPGRAVELSCPTEDVPCLIAAIHTANASGQPSTITLVGQTIDTSTGPISLPARYTLTSVDNETDGPNGLPSVRGTLTIRGGPAFAFIERGRFDPFPLVEPPAFRLIHVAPTGMLTLERLVLRGGGVVSTGSAFGGGILNNGGTLVLDHVTLANNRANGVFAYGGAVFNNEGTVTMTSSTLTQNATLDPVISPRVVAGFGGGLATAGGRVRIAGSSILRNRVNANAASGGGLADVGEGPLPRPGGAATVEVINTTIALNVANGFSAVGGGIATSPRGAWTITNTTITANLNNVIDGVPDRGAGISASGPVSLLNTVIAMNRLDCSGPVTSLDHNFIGNPSGCSITLQPHDLTGDPRFDGGTDSNLIFPPGNFYIRLSPTSPLIDAGNPETCPPIDQVGQPRVAICDIGAIESPSPSPLTDFVVRLYEQALGREPSAADLAAWLGSLQPDPTLARAKAAVRTFFEGGESLARPVTPSSYVTSLYRAILGREPDAPELAGWVQTLLERFDTATREFLGSAEFRNLVPDCRDAAVVTALVTRLYEHPLGRTPSAAEVTAWVTYLGATCALEGAVATFLRSAEYVTVPRTLGAHVTVLYRALLAREPQGDDVSAWVAYLSAQRAFIEDQFVDSAEFRARQLFR